MAAFDFPASPSVGQTYTLNGVTYTWDGQAWMGGPIANSPYATDAQYWQALDNVPADAGVQSAGAFQSVPYLATTALNSDNGINFVLAAPTGSLLLDNWTKTVGGRAGTIYINPPSGDRTLTWGNKWFFAPGGKPGTLTSGLAAVISYQHYDSIGNVLASFSQGWTNA